MTTEQLKSEVESGNMEKLAEYSMSLVQDRIKALGLDATSAHERTYQLKRSIIDALYYLRLGETGRATEILNQALLS